MRMPQLPRVRPLISRRHAMALTGDIPPAWRFTPRIDLLWQVSRPQLCLTIAGAGLGRLEHPNLLTDADRAVPFNDGFDMALELR